MSRSALQLAWRSLDQTGHDQISRALTATGITITEDADALLVTTDDYLHPALQSIASRETRPWLLAGPLSAEICIGPTFQRDESTCWHCLAHWMRARRNGAADSRSLRFVPEAIGPLVRAAAQFASGVETRTLATLEVVNTFTFAREAIVVPARLRCSCRGPRVGTPSTFAVMNNVFGLAFDLERHEPAPNHLHHAACLHVYPDVQRGTRLAATPASAFGRGRSAGDAVNGCIAEAIERYSAVWQGTEPMVLAKYQADNIFVAPESILIFSEQQYVNRTDWNRTSPERFRVPEPFKPATETYWSPIRSLHRRQSRLAPTALCYGGFTGDPVKFGMADSIGCAAGASLEEAILSALLEKVERDALAIWWYNRADRPHFELRNGDARLQAALAEARDRHLQVEILDITSDIDVPTYVSIGTDVDGRTPCFGAAANPDPVTAASRATEEMLQMDFWSVRASLEPSVQQWLRSGSLKGDPHLSGGDPATARRAWQGDMNSMLSWTLARLVDANLEAFFVDLTRPEVGLPVARVIIPGSRHCWNRLGPGRLYEVPVKLGWAERRPLESELNPAPCPL